METQEICKQLLYCYKAQEILRAELSQDLAAAAKDNSDIKDKESKKLFDKIDLEIKRLKTLLLQ